MISLVICLCLARHGNLAQNATSQELSARVLRELPSAHLEIERAIKNGVIGSMHTETWLRPRVVGKNGKKQIVSDAPLVLIDAHDYTFSHYGLSSKETQRFFNPRLKQDVEEVNCHKNATRFQLRKFPMEKDYSIVMYSDNHNARDGYWIGFEFWNLVTAPFAFKGLRFRTIMEHPTFVLKEVAQVQRGRKMCLRIDFELSAKDLSPPHPNYRSGSIIVCPDQSWAIQEARLGADLMPDDFMAMKVDYSDSTTNEIPMPCSVIFNYNQGDERKRSRQVYENRGIKFNRPSDEEFTLGHYGIPDVGKPIARRNRWSTPLMFIGLAVLALVVSIALKLAASRRERRAG